MNESELQIKAERFKSIKKAANKIKKQKTDKFTQRRRELEYKRDLERLKNEQS